MNGKMKIFLTLGIGLIIIAVTLVLFLIGFNGIEKTTLNWLAMTFLLISEVMLIAGLLLSPLYIKTMNAVLITSGVYSTLFAYWIITACLAIFAKVFFADNLRAFISTQLIVFGIVAIVIIALFISAANVKSDDDKIKNRAVILKNSENIAFSLASNPQYRQFKNILDRLYEELKYSDNNAEIADLDQLVFSAMNELAEKLNKVEVDNEDIEKKINSIILHVKERNRAAIQIRN